MKMREDFSKVFNKAKLFAFDLDGTTLLGLRPLEGVREFLRFLEEREKKFCFLTNNSSRTNGAHADFLSKVFGIQVTHDELLSSLDVTKRFLESNGVEVIYPFLNEEVKKCLNSSFKFDELSPQYVVIGFNTDTTYEQLVTVSKLIFKGVPYILVHPDLRCPTEFGYIPDAGAFAKMFEFTTDRKPAWVGGKPNEVMIEELCRRFSVREEDIVYVGDRLYTDMDMVVRTNVKGVLVLTGETTLEEYKEYAQKHDTSRIWVFDNMRIMMNATL